MQLQQRLLESNDKKSQKDTVYFQPEDNHGKKKIAKEKKLKKT